MLLTKGHRIIAVILMFFAFFCMACSNLASRVPPGPKDLKVSFEARELLSVLENQNYKLETFKGTGRITFREDEKNDLSARVAWVGAVPGKLRIVLRSVSGQPMASMASDGEWVYFFSHAQGKYFKKRASTTLLQRFLSVSITPDDVVYILAGRVPVNEHSFATVRTDRLDKGCILVLESAWGNAVEKIYFEDNKKDVRKVEVFDQSGALIYRVEFYGKQTINDYQIPVRLILSDKQGSGFQLEIDRYWVDVAVSPSIFVLAPPETKGADPGEK